MSTSSTFAVALALAAALFAGASPPASANDPCEPPSTCVFGFENTSSCAVNEAVDGRTCIRRIGFGVQYPRFLGGWGVSGSVELSNGNVNLVNTVNTWTGDAVTLVVHTPGGPVVVQSYGYQSAQEPPQATTAQLERLVLVQGAPVGASTQIWQNAPVYCNVISPLGTHRVDCTLTPVYELLPA